MQGTARRAGTDPEVIGLTQGLIGYVRELVRSRYKPVRDCDRYTSQVWLADLPEGVTPAATRDDGVLLLLDHVPHRVHPPLPDILDGWVDVTSLGNPDEAGPELADEGPALVEIEQDDGSTRFITAIRSRNECLDVLRAYQEWVVQWRQWAAAEIASGPRRRLYENVARMAREVAKADDVYEVVLGVGLLARRTPGQPGLSRHIVTKKLAISTDRATARITVTLAPDSPVRFEDRDFLDTDDGYSLERAEQVRADLAALEPHPLADEVVQLLDGWAGIALDVGVRFSKGWERQAGENNVLCLSVAPAILLRERDANALVQYYEQIAASLSGSQAYSPLGLAQLVAPLEKADRLAWHDGPGTRGHEEKLDPEPLFPLATNEAQRDVLDRLRSDTAVVVQGPPGTGKTHTIANLTCALLAQGNRVLVTSQKDQALRVLRNKLPGPVRDLCVLLTGLQRGGSDELERSIAALSNQVSSSSPDALSRTIARLEEQRILLLGSQTRLREGIRELREAEWVEHPEVAPGFSGTLAAITRHVMTVQDRFGWLPALPSSESAEPPIGMSSVLNLRRLLASATAERTARRQQRLPDIRQLPSADTFSDLVSSARRYEQMAADTREPARTLSALGGEVLGQIAAHVQNASAALHYLGLPLRAAEWDPASWLTAALADRFTGRRQDLWRRVAAGTNEARVAQASLDALGMRFVHVPQAPASEIAGMLRTAGQLRQHLSEGGRIRQRFASAAQRAAQPLLDACTVDGQPVADLAGLDAVIAWLRAQMTAVELADRWASVGVRIEVGAESLPVILSRINDIGEKVPHLEAVGAARDAVDRLLVARGVHLPVLSSPAGWDVVTNAVATARELLDARHGHTALQQLPGQLPQASLSDPPELAALRRSVTSQDASGYAAALAGLRTAVQQQDEQRQCDELLDRLRLHHPALADQLCATAEVPVWENRLADWPEAWAWAAAMAFCTRMRDAGRGSQLQQELDETDWRLTSVTEELAAARAWLHCLRRMSQEQRQAFQSYRSAMSSLGKGTGRYAPRHRRAARDAMEIARDAVPAWIMPLQKIVETITPTPNAFDVVIVDEASQAGLDAMFLLWLASRVIVVGDDKQCAPSFAIMEHQRVFDRLDAYLPDLRPAFRDDFRPGNNLYQLLSARFPDVIRLTEHFRCMPEIIGWSSAQFYDPPLQPLRQFGADRLDPLRVVAIEGAYTEGRDTKLRNPLEAKQLVEKLHELVEDPAYSEKTFGVITLQGTRGLKGSLQQCRQLTLP